MALEDRAKNTAETARGKAKDVIGRVTDDTDLEAEGKVEQVAGHLKQAGEKVKDAVHSVEHKTQK
ncbi:MAG: CsbD family protein [Acidimicrobiales bacterium]